MQPNSTLIYGEIVAIGRVANNERFEFRQFSSHLKIQLLQNNGQTKPLVLDCIQWQPAQMKLTALSQMEDFSHQGSLVYLNLQKTPTDVKTNRSNTSTARKRKIATYWRFSIK